VDEPIPQASAFRIQLPTFEGPLDLLLHLIRKHELDIIELPIAFVTERYLDYLQMMQELDLDVASEYLLMAATLAHIKSKSLLPSNAPEQVDEPDEAYREDPRAELIRRLLEYQKYKAAGEQLAQRPMAGRDVFQRGMSAPEAQGQAPLAGIELYKLLDAFQNILKRVSGRVALEVTAEQITIGQRISELSDLLRLKRGCTFEELFEAARTRYEVVVTFLALLEMTKLRITRIYQADPKSTLHVQFALLDADSPSVPPEAGDEAPSPQLMAAEDAGLAEDAPTDQPLMAAEDDPDLWRDEEDDRSPNRLETRPDEAGDPGEPDGADPGDDGALDPDELDEPAAQFDPPLDATPEAVDFEIEPSAEIDVHDDEAMPEFDQDGDSGAASDSERANEPHDESKA
jgi:segregation and condensation protein A